MGCTKMAGRVVVSCGASKEIHLVGSVLAWVAGVVGR